MVWKWGIHSFQFSVKRSINPFNKLCCVPSLFQTVGLPGWIDYSPWPQKPQSLERHANPNNMHNTSIQLSSSSAHISCLKFKASPRTLPISRRAKNFSLSCCLRPCPGHSGFYKPHIFLLSLFLGFISPPVWNMRSGLPHYKILPWPLLWTALWLSPKSIFWNTNPTVHRM